MEESQCGVELCLFVFFGTATREEKKVWDRRGWTLRGRGGARRAEEKPTCPNVVDPSEIPTGSSS